MLGTTLRPITSRAADLSSPRASAAFGADSDTSHAQVIPDSNMGGKLSMMHKTPYSAFKDLPSELSKFRLLVLYSCFCYSRGLSTELGVLGLAARCDS